jgi:chromatin segregation and condensation protein Rec8/ScpA/Scc1 (kleisin family)
LFEEDYTKSEAINTFLAILELLKKQFISAEQNELFSDITITYKGEEVEDLGELETEY